MCVKRAFSVNIRSSKSHFIYLLIEFNASGKGKLQMPSRLGFINSINDLP